MKLLRYKATFAYLFFIILINTTYPYFPFMTIAHTPFSSGDMLVGAIYIFRDFAQREIRHYVILAMLLGVFISYLFADEAMVIASVCAFTVAETIDWAIFTFTGKPLSQRLLWSSAISVPADTLIFLAIYGPFNFAGILVLCASKFLGVLIVWMIWKRSQPKSFAFPEKITPPQIS
jgi:uncharacterized PurR-regulated membrane protein YhhQ (DUF165 family)